MAPRGRPTRLNPNATPTPVADPTTTTSVTSAQLQAMIDQGVTAVLAARATTRNGDENPYLGNRGTEGVVDLTQWFEDGNRVSHKQKTRGSLKTLPEITKPITEQKQTQAAYVAGHFKKDCPSGRTMTQGNGTRSQGLCSGVAGHNPDNNRFDGTVDGNTNHYLTVAKKIVRSLWERKS
ncbi:hypothetical protein Tco_1546237 [Tanacetum coccineum]